jgi:hypothetical protein
MPDISSSTYIACFILATAIISSIKTCNEKKQSAVKSQTAAIVLPEKERVIKE